MSYSYDIRENMSDFIKNLLYYEVKMITNIINGFIIKYMIYKSVKRFEKEGCKKIKEISKHILKYKNIPEISEVLLKQIEFIKEYSKTSIDRVVNLIS